MRCGPTGGTPARTRRRDSPPALPPHAAANAGTKRVAVVVDKYDQSQDRMHLDCVFSILGRNIALLYEHAIGPDAAHRRIVHEFTLGLVDNEWDGSVPDFEAKEWSTVYVGKYRISQRSVPFDRYLAENGYKVISVSKEDQLQYGCNCLNLGNSHIVCVNDKTARIIARDADFSGLIEHIDFSAITCTAPCTAARRCSSGGSDAAGPSVEQSS